MGKSIGLYILRRVAMIIPQMLAISLTVFLLVRLIPGDPTYVLLGPLVSGISMAIQWKLCNSCLLGHSIRSKIELT